MVAENEESGDVQFTSSGAVGDGGFADGGGGGGGRCSGEAGRKIQVLVLFVFVVRERKQDYF